MKRDRHAPCAADLVGAAADLGVIRGQTFVRYSLDQLQKLGATANEVWMEERGVTLKRPPKPIDAKLPPKARHLRLGEVLRKDSRTKQWLIQDAERHAIVNPINQLWGSLLDNPIQISRKSVPPAVSLKR